MAEIKAQKGAQSRFLSSDADILIYGGSAGGAKSYSLLMEGGRNIEKKGYSGIIFRLETTDIRDGGLWDEAFPMFSNTLGCRANQQALTFRHPEGGMLKFDHLQREKDVYGHQGKQYAFIGFDELTQFSESKFFYLLTRNRSVTVSPYMRGTCNPDPDSFLVNGKEGWGSGLISWWIDQDGFPIPERDGAIRYMYRQGDAYDWDDSRESLIGRHEPELREIFNRANDGGEVFSWHEFCRHAVKSVSFIRSSIYDNKILLRSDPAYLANLNTQDSVTKSRLLEGNWKTKAEGSIFKRAMFGHYDEPPYLKNLLIFSDTAQSTAETAAYTVHLLAGYNNNGFYILDVLRERLDADDLLKKTIAFWNKHKIPKYTNKAPTVIRIENKSSGIGLNQQLRNRRIPIHPIERSKNQAGSKWERAQDAVYMLNGTKILLPTKPNQYTSNVSWCEPLISECLGAEKGGDKKGYWDQVDTLSDAINEFYSSNKLWVM